MWASAEKLYAMKHYLLTEREISPQMNQAL